MKMAEVKEKAKMAGVIPGKLKKTDLIRAIQEAEGNNPCFQTRWEDCHQTNCCWRADCDCLST